MVVVPTIPTKISMTVSRFKAPLSFLLLVVVSTYLLFRAQTIHVQDSKNTPPDRGASSQHDVSRVHRSLQQEEDAFAPRTATALLGIFSSNDIQGQAQRQYYRNMFREMAENRVCSLGAWNDQCIWTYTFLVGKDTSNTRTAASEEKDLDVTELNCVDQEGLKKALAAIRFVSKTMQEKPSIDYYIKVGADTLLQMDKFFQFVESHLWPAPFHKGIFGGALRDKAMWDPKSHRETLGAMSSETQEMRLTPVSETDLPRIEGFWGNEYEGVHLYMSSQLYFMGPDLVQFILEEAPLSKERIGPGGYLEHLEGHDISAMIFHHPTPVQIVAVPKSQQFWKIRDTNVGSWQELVQRMQQRT
eukprot:Nitzschia sp. Nitz4//scaffold94_size78252//7855//9015//NITZ4_005457-RA/size78252-augustus-gene-0.69-mRNA-1//-1//CDS//3329560347//377//frame0